MKLKYFLISASITLILSILILFIIPLIVASSFTGGLLPFGGLLGIAIYARFLPLIMLGLIFVYAITAALIAPKGHKISSIVMVLLGFIAVIIIISAFSQLSYTIRASGYEKSQTTTSNIVQKAIDEKNPGYCEDIYNSWKQKKGDVRSQSSSYYRNLCYFWLAMEINDYTYCEKIDDSYDSPRKECWTMAALKNRDINYCYNINTDAVYMFTISNCLTTVGKVKNDSSPCDIVKERYDKSGWYASRCYEQVKGFNKTYAPGSDWCTQPFCGQCPERDVKPSICDYDYNLYVDGY